jgi:Domain of unknown function (DUF4126)
MDASSLAAHLYTVGLAIALAACAGFRAWLPLLLAGGVARLGWLELGPSFTFLASDKALLIFAVASVLELAGDKIPVVDHALDVIGTPLRPAVGALLAASVLGFVPDPLTALLLGVAVGAPAALVPHAAKSTLRAASTVLTGGLANPLISVLEDVVTVSLFALAILVPLLVVLLVVLVGGWTARRLSSSPPSVKTA